ncbi:MAG: hypothetical protein LBT14_12085 [Treponema sp.]|jgi:hypothetical protein|nr:hypothetical protein [Treponema sp.]
MDNKDFMEEYNSIFERTIIFSIKATCEGLVSLENIIDERKYNKKAENI